MTDPTSLSAALLVMAGGLVVLALIVAIGIGRKRRLRHVGFAARRQIAAALSLEARQRGIATVRASMAAADRNGQPATEYGIDLGRANHTGQQLWASFEDVVGLVAPPRAGKTGTLAGTVVDAPGAVLVTSTRADIYSHTEAARRARGPVALFNPDGLGGLASTFRWSPIAGCEDPDVAYRRAGYLLSGSPGTKGTEARGFWEGTSFRVLSSYLFAAAVSGAGMRQLHGWVNNPYDRRPLDILEAEPTSPHGWARELEQLLDAPEKTLRSIFLTLSLTLSFMGTAAVAEAVTPKPGEPVFDVDAFLAAHGSLYLLGEDREHGSIAPLFACLTSEVYERARATASRSAGGRLDPPLLLVLDEVAAICPVPLERWTSVAGGWGIPLCYAIQSPSQLYERWGRLAGQTIWNNTTALLVLGGLSNADALRELSELCGEREETAVTVSHDGERRTSTSTSTQRVPVMTPAAIRMLGDWEALVIHRNLKPIKAALTPIWKRR